MKTKMKIVCGYRYRDEVDEGGGGRVGDSFGSPEVFPGYLLALSLSCKDDCIGGGCPIGSRIEGKLGSRAGSMRRKTTKNITTGV